MVKSQEKGGKSREMSPRKARKLSFGSLRNTGGLFLSYSGEENRQARGLRTRRGVKKSLISSPKPAGRRGGFGGEIPRKI